VVQAGLARVVGQRVGRVLQVQESAAAGAHPHPAGLALEHGQPDHPAIEIQHAVEVAHAEPEPADAQRRAARQAGEGGRVGGVHPRYIVAAVPRGNGSGSASNRSGQAQAEFLVHPAQRGLVRFGQIPALRNPHAGVPPLMIVLGSILCRRPVACPSSWASTSNTTSGWLIQAFFWDRDERPLVIGPIRRFPCALFQ
jgi:hypothetical protein